MKRARLVVLISGQGSNLQALIDACKAGILAAEIVAVVSNRAEAYGLERAKQAHIPTQVSAIIKGQARDEYDLQLAEQVAAFKPDFIILAGFMRILSNNFLAKFPQQVINLHPALPGQFPGTAAIERAFQAFQEQQISHTGAMVHFVPDEQVDCGPVIAQVNVPIKADDSLDKLTARMHQAEHQLLISALQTLLSP